MTNTQLTDTAAYLLTIITACHTGEWTPLLTIRTESGLTRDAADAALIELHRARLIRLESDPVAYIQTDAYRAAAITHGGEAMHVLTT